MELKYEILLLLIISTCLEISNCMVIPEPQENESIKLEETEQKSLEIKPLETDFVNTTSNDPTTPPGSETSTEVSESMLRALTNEPDVSKLTESTAIILSEAGTVEDEDPLANHIDDSSNSTVVTQNVTDAIIKPEQYYSKQISNQNLYEKEEIVQPPPTINYEEQVKNIIKEKGSLSDIPDLEIRKTLMTELLDVDYPQNIRPDHAMEKTKEIATEQAQTTKSNDETSDIPPVTDSKYNEPSLEKTETSSEKLNENEAKSEITLTQSVTDENTNNISNIDDELKINLGLKKKSRQLNFLNLETNSVSGQTESIEPTTTEDNNMKNQAEQDVQDKEDDKFFADVLEPSKTQKSVFYLKIDTNAPFEILDRERLVRWMDRQSKSMETDATKKSDEIKDETEIVETGDSLKTFGMNEKVESENQKEINSISVAATEISSSNVQSSERHGSFSGTDIVSMPEFDMSVAYAGESEMENQESGAGVQSAIISETPIVMNTDLGILELNLLTDNTTDITSEDGLSALTINEIKTVENTNLNDSVNEKKEITLEQQEQLEITTQTLSELKNELTEKKETTASTPDAAESVQEKNTKKNVNLDLLKLNSSEDSSSSESKEDKTENKTETTKKDSSEENSSESKEKIEKVKKPKDDSSEEDSKESKEKKSKTDINELNKQDGTDKTKLNDTDSLVDIPATTENQIIDIRIGSGNENANENKTKNTTENVSSESSESMESSMPKGRSLDLSAVEAKNSLRAMLPNHDVYRKSVGQYSNDKNDSQPASDFSSGLQPNPSLKVLLPLYQEKVVPVLSFETTTLLPLKAFPNLKKTEENPPPNPPQMSEIPVDADILNEILNSDDAIASASIGKASRQIEDDNKSILSYLLSSTVVVMIIGILMGTFYKYHGRQGTLNIELEERKNGKNDENSNDDLQEVSISTPSSSDSSSCQSNSLLATSPSIISSENNLLTSNASSPLFDGTQIKINENNVSTITVSE